MNASSRLALPYLLPQQALKHLTHNEALRRLDVLVQTRVVSATTVQEPVSAAEGDLYILPPGRAGPRWSAMEEGAIALFENGAFVEVEPVEGQIVHVGDRGGLLVRHEGHWSAAPLTRGLGRLGINADASDGNRLTVAADAELLTHDARTPGSGDARKVINKAATMRTASVVFQTGFSGRAEFGLVGSDDLALRVSADGAAFCDALRVEAATGRVAIGGGGAPVCALDVAGTVRLRAFAKADLPPAGAGAGQMAFVSDDAGGPVVAFSDGTLWRRLTDRAPVV
ncbi:MAG: DUF2793 domain-containing protein [Methylobacterium sp.]